MTDSNDVTIGKLGVWVKATLTEIKSIKEKIDIVEKDLQEKYIELVKKDGKQDSILNEILSNRKNCDKNFINMKNSLDAEIADRKLLNSSNNKIRENLKYAAGWVAGIVFFLAVLRYFKLI